jgi:hypothetical protein
MTQAEARQQFATSHLYWHGGHCWDAMTPSRRMVYHVRENVQRDATTPSRRVAYHVRENVHRDALTPSRRVVYRVREDVQRDAMTPSRRVVYHVRENVQRDAMTPSRRVVYRVRENVQREAQRDAAEPNSPEPKWREAMSEMLTANETPSPSVNSANETPSLSVDSANEAPSPSVNWENRWVEIAQVPTLAGDKAAQEDAAANATHRIEPMLTPVHVLLAFLSIVLALITAALAGHEKGRWQYDQRLSG